MAGWMVALADKVHKQEEHISQYNLTIPQHNNTATMQKQ